MDISASASASRRAGIVSGAADTTPSEGSRAVQEAIDRANPDHCPVQDLVEILHYLACSKQDPDCRVGSLVVMVFAAALHGAPVEDRDTVQARLLVKLAGRLANENAANAGEPERDAPWQEAVSQALEIVFTAIGKPAGFVLDALSHACGHPASTDLGQSPFMHAVESASQQDSSVAERDPSLAAASQQHCRYALRLLLSDMSGGIAPQLLALEHSGKSAGEITAEQGKIIMLHREAEQMLAAAEHGSSMSRGHMAVRLVRAICDDEQASDTPAWFQHALQARRAPAGASSSQISASDGFETALLYRLIERMGGGDHFCKVLQNEALSLDDKKKQFLELAKDRQASAARLTSDY